MCPIRAMHLEILNYVHYKSVINTEICTSHPRESLLWLYQKHFNLSFLHFLSVLGTQSKPGCLPKLKGRQDNLRNCRLFCTQRKWLFLEMRLFSKDNLPGKRKYCLSFPVSDFSSFTMGRAGLRRNEPETKAECKVQADTKVWLLQLSWFSFYCLLKPKSIWSGGLTI